MTTAPITVPQHSDSRRLVNAWLAVFVLDGLFAMAYNSVVRGPSLTRVWSRARSAAERA